MTKRQKMVRNSCVSVTFDMIDQIGGWTTAGVGQGYGEGYTLKSQIMIMSLLASE